MTIRLNPRNLTAVTRKGIIHLTPKEYDILEYMMKRAGECLSPEDIYRAVWGAEPFSCQMVVAVHICHLRAKLEGDPSRPRILKRIRGKGYSFIKE